MIYKFIYTIDKLNQNWYIYRNILEFSFYLVDVDENLSRSFLMLFNIDLKYIINE